MRKLRYAFGMLNRQQTCLNVPKTCFYDAQKSSDKFLHGFSQTKGEKALQYK